MKVLSPIDFCHTGVSNCLNEIADNLSVFMFTNMGYFTNHKYLDSCWRQYVIITPIYMNSAKFTITQLIYMIVSSNLDIQRTLWNPKWCGNFFCNFYEFFSVFHISRHVADLMKCYLINCSRRPPTAGIKRLPSCAASATAVCVYI